MRSREMAYNLGITVFLTKLLSVAGFTVLLMLSALIRVPLFFTPVPVTMQTMAVCLAGAVLGPTLALSAILAYIVLGFMGAPFFANAGTGFLYIFGPTGGYMIGFLLAAVLIGYGRRLLKSENMLSLFGLMISGMAVIYLCGGLWLSIGYHWSARTIVFLGMLPFAGADIVKALLAAVLASQFSLKK